jgi:DNA-binding SARP family transcriptional activator
MAGLVQLRILGPISIGADDAAITLPTGKASAALGLLALHPGKAISVNELTETLWEGAAPESARNRVQAAISALRKSLAQGADGGAGPAGLPEIETVGDGYRLRLNGAVLDLLEMRGLVRQAGEARQAEDCAGAAKLYLAADDIWTGRPFSGSANGCHLDHLADVLEQERLAALAQWSACALAVGDFAEVRMRLVRWTELKPADESLQAALILLYCASEQRSRALQQFEKTRAHLAAELGVDPGEKLRKLHLRILREM